MCKALKEISHSHLFIYLRKGYWAPTVCLALCLSLGVWKKQDMINAIDPLKLAEGCGNKCADTHIHAQCLLVDWNPELVSHESCYVSWGLRFTVNVFVLDFLWFLGGVIRDN